MRLLNLALCTIDRVLDAVDWLDEKLHPAELFE